MAKVIGIDLGTSNSACAIMEQGRPTIVLDECKGSYGPDGVSPRFWVDDLLKHDFSNA